MQANSKFVSSSLWIYYILMINDHIPIWMLLCDSHFRGFLWLSEHLSVGYIFLHLQRCDIVHVTSVTMACPHFSQSPNQGFELQKTRLSLGKHYTLNTPSAVYLTTALRTNVRHPRVQDRFFHANLIRECLVCFLSSLQSLVIFSAQGRYCIPSLSATSDKL